MLLGDAMDILIVIFIFVIVILCISDKEECETDDNKTDKFGRLYFLGDEWWKIATLEDVVKKIESGVDVNVRNTLVKGKTPLMYAGENNSNPEVIRLLVKYGADVDLSNEKGITPLMYASRNNSNPEVIAALLVCGADVKAKDKEGNTVLDYAKNNNKIYATEIYWLLNEVICEED